MDARVPPFYYNKDSITSKEVVAGGEEIEIVGRNQWYSGARRMRWREEDERTGGRKPQSWSKFPRVYQSSFPM